MRESSDVHLNVDIIAGDDFLPSNRADLDLDVDDTKRLRADVDLDETWVDRFVELAEPRDQTDGTCCEQ